MTDSLSHSALRKWRHHFSQSITLISVLVVGSVLALVGPFDTNELLSLIPRWIYWVALVALAYSVGFFCGEALGPHVHHRPLWQQIIAMGGLTGIGVTLVVAAQNLIVFGWFPSLADFPVFAATIIAVSILVSALFRVIEQHLAQASPAQAPPALLNRLPLDKRAALVALSVEDHYVRVRTTKGEEMLLMRLSDAMGEVGATPGLQVHRSHWVALDQVTAARREGDRAILTMAHGPEIPVSRANVAAIKEAGLLPR